MSQEQSTQQTVLRHEPTGESATIRQKEAVLLKGMYSLKYEPSMETIDTAVTLCARDYKGLNNFGTNGVIEWK